MKRAFACLFIAVLAAGQHPRAHAAQPAPDGIFADGRWEGEADLGDGKEPIVLRLFSVAGPSGPSGGLIDLPARRLFGYPLEKIVRDFDGIGFGLLDGAPVSGRIELRATSSAAREGEDYRVGGVARRAPAGGEPGAGEPDGAALGTFSLAYSGIEPRGKDFGLNYPIDMGRGLLPGSLLLPDIPGGGTCPVALILSGANADRDGNNYAVPGLSDALAELAIGLRARGIASLRYDKRGTGEAWALGENEEILRFDDHVEDARRAIAAVSADPRFTRLTVVGYGEGALVAAAALGRPAAGAAGAGSAAGLVAVCASGKTELETIQDALSSTPEENREEAEAIMTALKEGGTYPHPSPYFADFFRPSVQPYLASAFRYDIRAAFAAARIDNARFETLVIAGGSDLQVKSEDAKLLAGARPKTAYRVVPGMSHALKEVGEDVEANYSSFTDPSLPLSVGLVDLLEAFVKGNELPGSDPRDGL